MDTEFWHKKWLENDIRFHQDKFHPQLMKHSSCFNPGTILAPLCGKSLDMIYLASLGNKVVGVELSSIACRDFFKENNLQFVETQSGEFTVFESQSISLWCGDFFNLPEVAWKNVTNIYDRAALIALPEFIRQKYVAEILDKASRPLNLLLITVEYGEGRLVGPPFSVVEDEVKGLYINGKIKKLHTQTELRVMKEDTVEFTEKVFEISF